MHVHACLHICVLGGQKRTSDCLELKLQSAVTPQMGAGSPTQVL